MSALKSIIEANKAGQQAGIYSVCSAQPLVLRAALRHAARQRGPLLIEATANQVNQHGGYTGMTPADFIAFVKSMAQSEGVAEAQLLFGGDHLGPVAWKHLTAEQAMAEAEAMVRAYVEAGFCKIHLDASMACHQEQTPLADEVIAARAARLCRAAEAAKAPGQQLCYVIGTEVPAPGGVSSLEEGLQVTPVAAMNTPLAPTNRPLPPKGLGQRFGSG